MVVSKVPKGIGQEIGRGIATGITEGLGWVVVAIAFTGIAIVRQSVFTPQTEQQTTFQPYTVYTPYFIDESPPGSYDFTLERNNSKSIEIPSPCTGTIANVWYQGTKNGIDGNGGGQIVEVNCGDYIWLFAHLEVNPPVATGQTIEKGELIGIQGLTGHTTGEHIHLQIHDIDGEIRGERITDRTITKPMVERYIQWLRQGGEDKSTKYSRGADKYERAITMTLNFEGGCQNSKADQGNYLDGKIGHTCMGITPATAWQYQHLIGIGNFRGNPVEFSKYAHDRSPEKFRQSAAEILLDYADRAGCDELESPAYEVCADIAFNSGVGRSQKYLAKADQKNVADSLNQQHRADYQKWGGVYLPGWLNRASDSG